MYTLRNVDTSALLRGVAVCSLSCERGGLLPLLAGQDACASQAGCGLARLRGGTPPHPSSDAPSSLARCLQNYIPAQSLTLSCPVCRQTSILPEQASALQRTTSSSAASWRPCSRHLMGPTTPRTPPPQRSGWPPPLPCPNHEGKVGPSRPSEARTWGGGAGRSGEGRGRAEAVGERSTLGKVVR